MSFTDAIRAEVGNQLLLRLRRLSEEEWVVAERMAAEREQTFTLAYRLAHDAMVLMAEEHGAGTHALLLTQLSDADRVAAGGDPALTMPRADLRQRLARGVVLGAFLRETRGFNTGAFRELVAPFALCIDVSQADRIARAAHQPDAGDYSVHGPTEWQTPTLRSQLPRTA